MDKRISYLPTEIIFYLNISTWFNPLNYQKEKDRFFKSKSYEPQFEYLQLPAKKIYEYQEILKKNQQKVVSREINDDYKNFLLQKYKEAILCSEMILNRGKKELEKSSILFYQCNFDKKTIDQAKKDVLIKFLPNKEYIKTESLIKEIQKRLREYKAKNWQLTTSDEAGFHCRVIPQKKLIIINERINWDFFTLDGFIAHEIDGHVLRALNSQKQKNILYKFQLPFYIKTEEGLASYLADFCSDNKFGKTYHGLKYLGCILAMQGSFQKVYEFFLDNNFSPDLAFLTSFRTKRGFEDTSIAGCFAREAMYYEGMQEVKEYIDSGGDLTKLFSGKAGLKDIEKLSGENIVVPRRILAYK